MSEILGLLPKKIVKKLQKISKELQVPEEEIVKKGIETYIRLLEKGRKLEVIGFGMWKDREMDSEKWVEELRRKEWVR
jgi:nucleoid DNA-binding protein